MGPQMSFDVSGLCELLQALKEWAGEGPLLSLWSSSPLYAYKIV